MYESLRRLNAFSFVSYAEGKYRGNRQKPRQHLLLDFRSDFHTKEYIMSMQFTYMLRDLFTG